MTGAIVLLPGIVGRLFVARLEDCSAKIMRVFCNDDIPKHHRPKQMVIVHIMHICNHRHLCLVNKMELPSGVFEV